MSEPSNEITSTADMALAAYEASGSYDEPRDVDNDIVATHKPEGKGIEFHVSMRDYTMADMEALIVEAAATKLLSRLNSTEMSKKVDAMVVASINAKADAVLERVTAEILDQPMTPSFGDKKPVTMRELLGLCGREYLTQTVDSEGKPASNDGWGRRSNLPRLEYLAGRLIDRKFKNEVEKTVNASISEVQRAVKADLDAHLAAQKARVAEALAAAITPAKGR